MMDILESTGLFLGETMAAKIWIYDDNRGKCRKVDRSRCDFTWPRNPNGKVNDQEAFRKHA